MKDSTKDFVFKKKYGQNFISDKNLLTAIVNDAEITSADEVLEIGAGAGTLTQVLSTQAKKVVSFEIDKDLQSQLLELKLQNVNFIFDDFMQYSTKQVEGMFSSKFKVVANLPYYITTPILFKLFESEKVESITIMVQKEVAQRACAKVGNKDYGILSVMTELYGDAQITRIVNRQMFKPTPNVDSAVLRIKIREKFTNLNKVEFSKFVRTCFAMRRKTLQNNLSNVINKAVLHSVLDENTLKRRAETFTLQEFVEMFKKLSEKR